MNRAHRPSRAPALLAVLVALVVLGYGPATPELYSGGPSADGVAPVVLGGSPLAQSIPLTGRPAVRPSSSLRPVMAAAVLAILLAAAGTSSGPCWVPVRTRGRHGPARPFTPGRVRRRGPPPVTA